ncbi:Biotin--protein ligase [Escovopsis weberi]|uniref:Biotin--protein ligase n=1 Tax=Escovopsis weberi TaxID=150374 RepID=A0A0M8N502_ESCWE|nr:Biotin--protein ligase [Escovopsis weberi]
MAPAKLNVLVYSGTGVTSESVRHCMLSLRALLSPNYAVIPVNETAILREPWASTCALLVIPGGADLGYCRALGGDGNRRIAEYVRRGGSYLGLCAGGYYGSGRCEFEVGDRALEIVGRRELAFFPGACRGGAFKGFEYHSERGARAVRVRVDKESIRAKMPADFFSYYNGGGVFVDAAAAQRVEVLASYQGNLDVDGGDGRAAVVLCHVGEGKAVLFAAASLLRQPSVSGYDDLIQKLAEHDRSRVTFLGACLAELGLKVDTEDQTPPPLSALHLTALDQDKLLDVLFGWEDIIERNEKGEETIKGETDVFRITSGKDQEGRESLPKIDAREHVPGESVDDYTSIVKRIVVYDAEKPLPESEITPRFHHERFYAGLKKYRMIEREAEAWGNVMLYGDVVTSTNTILEKNPKLISKLPSGFTFTASVQVAGRGRGTNVWIAPPGSLLFSTVINHPAHLAASRPIIFIQYLAAIAIVEAIQSYDRGYGVMPVKLKWPNDIYALDPTKPASAKSYVKIGGILAQCTYSDGSYQVVLGIGINTTNPRPTTSISDLLPPNVPPLHIETLLARILTRLECIYSQFRREGFSADLESRYYRHWLHTGQAITLEAEGGARARVIGITRDWGMLRVEETDREGRGTGKIWGLQSDENSFDYWKGLVRRKN